jgi:enoyl-CoA hydratase/carnithine racemase
MTTATPTPSHPDGSIDCEVRDAVLLIGINRPAKRNGFTPKMYRELGEAYTRLDDDPDLRVGVLHAMGDHFTAGLDLPTIAPLMQRGEKAVPLGLVDPVNLGMDGYRRRTKPMVVAVKGITYTLGIELMLAADIVIAADNCRFSQLEVKRGIMATGGATLRMAERAGLGNALLHLANGRRVRRRRGAAAELCAEGGASGHRAGRSAGHCPLDCSPGPAGGRGDTAERIESARARPGGGDARVHRHPATPVPQRGCGRGRALLRGATGRPVPGPLSSAHRHPRPTAAGHNLEEYPFILCAI